MDISGFHPPDYGLIDDDPLAFKQQFQAFVDALIAHQSDAGDLERVNADLRAALDEAGRQQQEVEQQAQAQREATEALRTQHGLAVAAYRQALLGGDPSLPPELVQGETVDEVDRAVEKARNVVQYIRDKLATTGGAGQPGAAAVAPPRVPAGVPGRTIPDFSAMTAREKLIYGTSRSES